MDYEAAVKLNPENKQLVQDAEAIRRYIETSTA